MSEQKSAFDELLARHSCLDEALQPLYSALFSALRNGDLCLQITSELKPLADKARSLNDPKLVWRGDSLYLAPFDEVEESIAKAVAELITEPLSQTDISAPPQLNREQREAFDMAMRERICIIAGGPGTGKSFLVENFLKAFEDRRLLVAAPTGKAVMQLKERVGEHPATFMTLHKALGAGRGYTIPLDYDLIIVDECSMLDARLINALLSARESSTRLILVGDPDQLPPVESGHIFTEIAELFNEISPQKIIRLNQVLRTESEHLLELAEQLKKGEMPNSDLFIDGDLEDVVCEYAKSFDTAEGCEKHLHSQAILSPLRRGPGGIDQLNSKIAEKHIGRYAPVIVKTSSERHGLINGEMGVGFIGAAGIEQLFFQGVELSSKQVDVELAFCLSVHKAQGSEFDRVLLLMPEGSERFGRQVLYTAATRAKKEIALWGALETYSQALKQIAFRHSGLRSRVLQILEEGQIEQRADGRGRSIEQ